MALADVMVVDDNSPDGTAAAAVPDVEQGRHHYRDEGDTASTGGTDDEGQAEERCDVEFDVPPDAASSR